MDSDDRDAENQSVGDAHMIKLIPQEDTSVANGTVLSISLSDGKVMQNLFAFMKICTFIYLQCTEEGFSFIGTYTNKQSKGKENTSEQRPDMVFYLTFTKDRIPEYFFFPNNMGVDMAGGKKTLTFVLSMNQISTMLKKTKIKATTIFRFDLNGKTNMFAMYIVDGISIIPYTLSFQMSYPIKDIVPEKITDHKLPTNYRFSVELLYKMINAAASKSDNVAYDFKIAIHKGGVAAKTDAPCVGAIPYGTMRENPHVFTLSHESTKYFGQIHKITPRGTVRLTAIDDTVFKVVFPIGSFGEAFIFQFPKQESNTIIEYQQAQISNTSTWNQPSQLVYNSNWQQPSSINSPNGNIPVAHSSGATWQQQQVSSQTSGWQQQYSNYSNQDSTAQNLTTLGSVQQQVVETSSPPWTISQTTQIGTGSIWNTSNIQQSQVSQYQTWQPSNSSTTETNFDASQYTNVYDSI